MQLISTYKENKMKNSTSNTAKLLSLAIIILGFFSSIALSIKFGNSYELTTTGLGTTRNLEKTALILLIGIVVTLIIGTILYCLGEIIQKLQNIEYLSQLASYNKREETTNFNQFIESLTDEDKVQIMQQYKK